jgi:hypothetical protein
MNGAIVLELRQKYYDVSIQEYDGHNPSYKLSHIRTKNIHAYI